MLSGFFVSILWLDVPSPQVAAAKGSYVATMLDTKGPEVRTAMLQGGKSVQLEAGQEVIIVAVGDAYTTWEGGFDPAIGKVKIGLSYSKLCQSVKPGNTILMAGACCADLLTYPLLSDDVNPQPGRCHHILFCTICQLASCLASRSSLIIISYYRPAQQR
jgi:hypothetical protein